MSNTALVTLFDRVRGMPRTEFTGEFVDAKDCVYVPQHYWAHNDHASTHPVIYSGGASYCFILGLHNPETRRSSLGHIDDATLVPGSVQKMINAVRQDSDAKIAFGIVGGHEKTRRTLDRILTKLAENKIDTCCAGDIHYPEDEFEMMYNMRSLGIDSRDGTFLTHIGRWDEGDSYHPISVKALDAKIESLMRGRELLLEEITLAR